MSVESDNPAHAVPLLLPFHLRGSRFGVVGGSGKDDVATAAVAPAVWKHGTSFTHGMLTVFKQNPPERGCTSHSPVAVFAFAAPLGHLLCAGKLLISASMRPRNSDKSKRNRTTSASSDTCPCRRFTSCWFRARRWFT